jgi:hypothetical protein
MVLHLMLKISSHSCKRVDSVNPFGIAQLYAKRQIGRRIIRRCVNPQQQRRAEVVTERKIRIRSEKEEVKIKRMVYVCCTVQLSIYDFLFFLFYSNIVSCLCPVWGTKTFDTATIIPDVIGLHVRPIR